MSADELVASIEGAHKRVRPLVLVTPLIHSRVLSSRAGARVFLKCESEQVTGSFKLRGATNKIALADAAARERGFVTASTGNHGLAMATALDALGIATGTIVLPTNAASGKVDLLRLFPSLELMFHGDDCVVAETHARKLADSLGKVFVSPYNDIEYVFFACFIAAKPHSSIIAGQGTVAVELLEQLPNVDVVFVTVGGGGLMSGIASYIKHKRPSCRVVGCLPAASPVMRECVKEGRIVDIPSYDTLSDGSAGATQPFARVSANTLCYLFQAALRKGP